jgi:hypothetical protein
MKKFLEIGNITHLLYYLASKYGESIAPSAPPEIPLLPIIKRSGVKTYKAKRLSIRKPEKKKEVLTEAEAEGEEEEESESEGFESS